MCLLSTSLVLGLWGADVACSLVSNPVGDTYLNIYSGMGWSGRNRSLVLLKAEVLYEEFFVDGRTGLAFMLGGRTSGGEEKQKEAFELLLEIADCHMEEKYAN